MTVGEYEVASPKIDKTLDKKKVVVISDLHSTEYGQDNQKLLDRIHEISPEIIIIAGDIPTVKEYTRNIDIAIKFIKNLSERYKIYYARGNHELRLEVEEDIYGELGNIYYKALENAGVELLINRSIDIGNIRITGLDLEKKYYKKFASENNLEDEHIHELLKECDRTRYNILIAHHPLYFKKYAKWGADLVLSGHYHGGLIRLPLIGGVVSPDIRLFPKYSAGEYREGNSIMVLSRGLGTHSINIRLFNKPEIVVLNFTQDNTQ